METYYALIDNNNIVTTVLVVPHEVIVDSEGNEDEELGNRYCQQFYEGTWVRTEKDGSVRKNYAGINYQYDSQRDAFIPPKPIPEAILDEETCRWVITEEMLLAYGNRSQEDIIPPKP